MSLQGKQRTLVTKSKTRADNTLWDKGRTKMQMYVSLFARFLLPFEIYGLKQGCSSRPLVVTDHGTDKATYFVKFLDQSSYVLLCPGPARRFSPLPHLALIDIGKSETPDYGGSVKFSGKKPKHANT